MKNAALPYKQMIIALAAVMIAGLTLTASARTMTVTENRSFGPVLSYDFTFDNVGAGTTNKLLMVCGTSDGGSTFSGWDSIRFVADVPGDTTSLTGITPPADWGTGATCLRFFLTSGGTVPDAVQLEGIEATQTDGNHQYILTSFTANGASKVEADFQFATTAELQCVFCSRAGANDNNYFVLLWLSSQKWRWDYNTKKLSSSETGTMDTERHTLRADSSGLKIDGTLVNGTKPTAATFTAGGPMSIFAAHTGGNPVAGWASYGKFKLYSFKAWADGSDDSTLALDLVPCMKNDGTVCLYNKVDGTFLENKGSGSFTAGEFSERIDAVSAPVTFQSVAGGTYTWVGGGDDDNITTDGNWQGGHAPDFDAEEPFVVFASGTAAVLDRGISVSGIAFDGVADFTVSSVGSYGIAIGAGGISNAPAVSASAVTVSAPVMPMTDQIWQMNTNVTFTLSGAMKKYGSLTPTITVRQGSFADPTITFIGAETAESAGDFAGDIVFEATLLPDDMDGIANVRASGFEPFGLGGTLKLRGQKMNRNRKGREAMLFLSNAVISKAVQYGDFYNVSFCTDDNTTNMMNGAFTAYNNSSLPPVFRLGTNSLLRLCGDMDFGRSKLNSDSADVSLTSSSSSAAARPTGKIVFDGRITRMPRRFRLVNAVSMELNAADNVITNLFLGYGDKATAVVRFGASYALSNGQAMVTFPARGASSRSVDFDLNGTVQHILGFVPNMSDTSRISSSAGSGTLRISQPDDVVFEGYVATNVTIQMEGAATLTFTNSTAFRAGSTIAVSNGTVAVSSATAFNEDVTLKLLGGKISIPEGQTALVGETYYLDEGGDLKPLLRGIYGPGDSTIGSFFAPGSGLIRVKKGEGCGLMIIVQ